MNRRNLDILIFSSLSALLLACMTFLSDKYLFNWIAFNYKFYLTLCIVILLLVIKEKYTIALFMNIGIIVGTFIGQYLGDYLRYLSMLKIDTLTSAEEVSRLSLHHGFTILIIILFISLIVGLIFEKNRPIKLK